MKYTPHKDSSVQHTIDRLLGIYENLGLKISIYDHSKSKKSDVFSCTVCIDNTCIFANGKGSTLQYSYASGLAELMERLENICFAGTFFIDYQDSVLIPNEDFLNKRPDVVDESFLRFYAKDDKNTDNSLPLKEILSEIQLIYGNKNEIKCVKYYDVNNKKTLYVPTIARKDSNGMCAGNTPEEALVQGFSELFERYVQNMTFIKQYSYPTIPDSEYAQYEKIIKIIKNYEKAGFTVQIKDASLGKNFPVVCVILIDSRTAKYTIHYGAHPILSVAIERTLTEIAQGRNFSYKDLLTKEIIWKNIKDYNDFVTADTKRECYVYGNAILHPKVFTSKPDWEYNPKTWYKDCTNVSNKQMLERILSFIKNNKYDAYIRDASFLGFPAFHIIVPQMSLLINKVSLDRLYNTYIRNEKLFKDDSENLDAIRMLKSHPNYEKLHNYIELPMQIAAQNYKQALVILEQIIEDANSKIFFNIEELNCLYDYISMVEQKMKKTKVLQTLDLFYKKSTIDKCMDHWINCPNPLKYWYIPNTDKKIAKNTYTILSKILKHYAKNIPNQENLNLILS